MNSRPVVVDTNVVVAGLLTRDAASPVARILDGMLAAAFQFVVSQALLTEYRAVLVRPALRKLHGLTVAEVETVLVDLAQHAIVLVPASGPKAPDAGDQFLWDLLAAREDVRLVTGDKRLLRDKAIHERVLPPRAFIEVGGGGQGLTACTVAHAVSTVAPGRKPVRASRRAPGKDIGSAASARVAGVDALGRMRQDGPA